MIIQIKIDSEILSTSQTLDFTGFGSKSFSLLYRRSKDGFENSTFHNMCDGKSNTLALIKSTTGYIFGGYTSVSWSCSGSYKIDSTAFLFTLTNPSYNKD